MELKKTEKDELDDITVTQGIKPVRANCCPYITILERRRHKQ